MAQRRSRRSISICTCRTTPSRRTTRRPSTVGAAACGHVQAASVHRSGKPGVQHVSVDAARRGNAPETSCWRIPRSSRRCSVAMRVWKLSGRTSRPGDATDSRRRRRCCRLLRGYLHADRRIPSQAQNRGVYPLGMSAIELGRHAGIRVYLFEPIALYTRDQAKDDEGRTLPVTGINTVVMDMNTIDLGEHGDGFSERDTPRPPLCLSRKTI